MSRRLEDLRNLGPAASRWLRDVGIPDDEVLQAVGPEEAFVRVVRAGHTRSVLMLWALFGALYDLDWRELPGDEKDRLREEVARLLAE